MREVASVCQDRNGFIWASSKTGILRLTNNNYHLYQLPYETADIIHTKLLYDNDSLLAYTNNGQIFLYNDVYDRFDLLIDARKPLKDTHLVLNRIAVDQNGAIFIAASSGLYRFMESELIKLSEEKFSDVHDFIWIDSQNLLLATNNGFWTFNSELLSEKQLHPYSVHNELKVTKLYYSEPEKIFWVGTSSDGLYLYDISKNSLIKSPISIVPNQPIYAMEANTDSTILVGIDGQGVWKMDSKGEEVLNIYKENNDNPLSLKGNGVYDIFVDKYKRVWIATYSGRLSYFDQESAEGTLITHQINNSNSLSNDNVNKVMEDGKGNIWFATSNGVSSWDVEKDIWRNYYKDYQEQPMVFLSLCEDLDGNIWAGTYSSGVYIIDGNRGSEIAHYSSLVQNLDFANLIPRRRV